MRTPILIKPISRKTNFVGLQKESQIIPSHRCRGKRGSNGSTDYENIILNCVRDHVCVVNPETGEPNCIRARRDHNYGPFKEIETSPRNNKCLDCNVL